MLRERHATEGLILERAASGEQHERYVLLAPDLGLIRCLRRRHQKASAGICPDVFDLCRVVLERSSTGGGWFITEYTLEHRHAGLGRVYESLVGAADYARLLVANAEHWEEPARLLQEAILTLDAFDRGLRAELVLLKGAYRFARLEGLPVREQWVPTLSSRLRTVVVDALNQPVEHNTSSPAEVQEAVASLRRYFIANTELRW